MRVLRTASLMFWVPALCGFAGALGVAGGWEGGRVSAVGVGVVCGGAVGGRGRCVVALLLLLLCVVLLLLFCVMAMVLLLCVMVMVLLLCVVVLKLLVLVQLVVLLLHSVGPFCRFC